MSLFSIHGIGTHLNKFFYNIPEIVNKSLLKSFKQIDSYKYQVQCR